MENISLKYIDIAKKKTGYTQRELAKKIGVSAQQISNLKHGGELKDGALIKLAQIAQVPASVVLAEKQLKKAKTEEESKFWKAVKNSAELAKLRINCILCQIGENPKLA